MSELKFSYYSGQVFELDQRTMNLIITDVHSLKKELKELKEEYCTAIGTLQEIATNKDCLPLSLAGAALDIIQDIKKSRSNQLDSGEV